MKPVLVALCAALFAAPAFAQIADGDVDALMKRWVAGYNKGDVAGLVKDVYAAPDEGKLTKMFTELRTDSFGKLEIYDFKACPVVGDKTRVQMNFARLYTFGGKMNDDESKLFELVKTPAGWRVASEAEGTYGDKLAC
ncbi:MAG TPA: hypothetical protein VGO52_13850 [Hyphomonadaceae bacterium]|jgi:hypothetical protein|nr:hypothetical protein [Hyphomonadaceae bacterium]